MRHRDFIRAASALLLFPLVAWATLVTIGGNGRVAPSSSDTTPNAFSFTDQTGVATSTTITSAPVAITGINASITCSATSGTIDKNSSGSFSSSQSVANNDTIRATHTSSASYSTATNTAVDCNGVSDTFTSTTTSGASGVFFEPDVDAATNVAQIFTHDRNCYGPAGVETWGDVSLISDTSRAGHTKSVRLTYPANDEAGCELKPPAFASTPSLFVRNYMKFSASWSGDWPLALKTSRYFTTSTWSTGPGEPNDYAYISEKLVANQYGMGTDDDLYAHGYNNAIYNLDLWDPYPVVNFGNGLPYIRTGHWYKVERWYVLNSGPDVTDGIMQVWIDDQLVVNRTNVPYRSTTRGNPNGTGWQSMWFGGNYTGSSFGAPSEVLYRDEQGYYMSTTLDR